MSRFWLVAVSALASAVLVCLPLRAQQSAPSASETTLNTVERCVAQHEQARILRLEEQWVRARDAMSACASSGCPLALRSDCQAWLDDVARLMPSLLIVVERDDGGRTPVSFELDGQIVALTEPSHQIEVLPGRHRLRFRLPPHADVEREVILQKGEKNHLVQVRFVTERQVRIEPSPRPAYTNSRPIPVATYLLAGGALAAFSISGALLVSALSAKDDADVCSPLCDDGTRQRIDLRLLLADVSGGVGLVLAGAATYTFANRPVVQDRASLPAPPLRGAIFSVRGRF
jgi:hypothetical protein